MNNPIQNENGHPNKNGGRFLELHSQSSNLSTSIQALEGQLRECFGRVVYSHKTHEKCADILQQRLSGLKLLQIVLSVITTGGFVSVLFGVETIGSIIASTVSATLLGLNIYMKGENIVVFVRNHRETAGDIWLIREKYQSLITDLMIGEEPLGIVQEKRDVLMKDLHSIYSNAPRTTYKAYKKAQQALKYSEDMTFSDEEIDAFLPSELKRSERNNSSNE